MVCFVELDQEEVFFFCFFFFPEQVVKNKLHAKHPQSVLDFSAIALLFCILRYYVVIIQQDAEVFLASEAKKAKVDNGTDKIAEADETPCSEKARAEA